MILGAVSVGIGQWSRFETERRDSGVIDGATFKTQGLLSRCISYDVTVEILELGLSLEQQPQVYNVLLCHRLFQLNDVTVSMYL